MLEEAISTTPPLNGKLRQPARRVAKRSSDEIFQRLRLAIMERRLPPGTQLVEQRLAAIFKVSRTKVREAIGRLVHDCIATNIPNRGAFVSSPSVEQAHEVFAARQLIEPALIREVTQQATAVQITVLRTHLQLERQAQETGDRQKVIALSGEFHYLVADMAGNSFLSRTLRELETLTALIITLFGTANHETCPSDHPALVDAIEQRDPQRAAELMLHHLAHVERSIKLDSVERPPATLEEVLA
ncbi:MAG: GntR family transcriptional regulator [Burkholderiaceae bacterium]